MQGACNLGQQTAACVPTYMPNQNPASVTLINRASDSPVQTTPGRHIGIWMFFERSRKNFEKPATVRAFFVLGFCA